MPGAQERRARIRLCRGDQRIVGGGSRAAAEHLAAHRGRMARIRAANRRGNGLPGGRQGDIQWRSLYLPVAALCMEPGGLSHRMAETGMSGR